MECFSTRRAMGLPRTHAVAALRFAHVLVRPDHPPRGRGQRLAQLRRLFVQRAIPNDALVPGDDDWIEAMFTALHRVVQDHQILVLTYRQALAALGGERIRVSVEAV